MKHLFFSFFTFAIMLFATQPCQALTVSAVTPSGHTLYYYINIVRGEAKVTSLGSSYGTALTGNLIIPDTVAYNGNTYSVTSIGTSAFNNCTSLTSVTIPNSVTDIGWSAFEGCTSLTSVTIPNSVTSIGNRAFEGCTSLTSVTIPNFVTFIGWSAFEGCTSLTSVTIPNSVTDIEDRAFEGCSSLTSITIPNFVTDIGSRAFEGCTSLTSVTIPNSVIAIRNHAFASCTSLTSVTIPNSVTSIGEYAFSHCSSLTSFTIPNSVTSIGNSVFSYCSSLTSITIPNSVTDIGNRAFEGCSSLTSISIPNSVTSIGEYAFSHCSSLTIITIPSSITTIERDALSYCTSLTSITIPDSVTSIGESVFYRCSSLTNITIPNSVTTIGEYAFSCCSSLTNITIPNSVTTIGSSAFGDCSSLTNITIPNSVTDIGFYAFFRCSSLTSISIPNSVTFIRSGTFWGCSSLNNVTIPNSVTSIGSSAFEGCSSLTSITIPDSVTSIGEYAFNGDTSITTMVVSTGNPVYDSRNNCNAIIETATNTLIAGCKGSIIPNSVTSIGNSAFADCSLLTSITIPNSVTSIENFAFVGCIIDTLNMGHIVPFTLSSGNTSLVQANVINIPCGATVNYQNVWGQGNYHEYGSVNLALFAPDNNGTVSIIPQNVQQETFCSGSSAVIQATANYGYHFTQWNDGNTDNPRTITLTQDTSFTAQFAKNQYTLTVSSNDITIGSVSGGGVFEYLDTATITASVTAPHHHFVRWNDGVTDTLRKIIITHNLSLMAIFAIDMHHVAVTVNNNSYGTVSGAGEFPYGSIATLTPNPESGYYFVHWNNGDTTNPNIFTVTGDTLLTALFAPEIVPSICMVSVENDRNVLSWEKELPVSSYNIYREGITSNVYELLATIPYDSLSVWTDTSSRPRTRSYRYRLSATDIYAHEADMSDIHKTMHLTISQGVGNQWNLVWTEYEGTNYTTYVIYRGSDASNIQQIDVMPSGGNTSYTDVNAPAGDVYYKVGIMLSSPCNPSKNNYMIMSNIATNSTVGIPANDIDNINVFAQNGHVIINSSNDLQDVRIYDLTGKLLKTVQVGGNSANISISDFAAGIYMVQIRTENGTVTRKVVK